MDGGCDGGCDVDGPPPKWRARASVIHQNHNSGIFQLSSSKKKIPSKPEGVFCACPPPPSFAFWLCPSIISVLFCCCVCFCFCRCRCLQQTLHFPNHPAPFNMQQAGYVLLCLFVASSLTHPVLNVPSSTPHTRESRTGAVIEVQFPQSRSRRSNRR